MELLNFHDITDSDDDNIAGGRNTTPVHVIVRLPARPISSHPSIQPASTAASEPLRSGTGSSRTSIVDVDAQVDLVQVVSNLLAITARLPYTERVL